MGSLFSYFYHPSCHICGKRVAGDVCVWCYLDEFEFLEWTTPLIKKVVKQNES